MNSSALKLLAVDDHPDNLTTLKAVVADVLPGVTILTALNGPRGLELARAEDPDVILLDIVMPEMDGFAVCRKLKSDERLRAIPVVFLTALRTDQANRIQALEAGAEGFLAKPLDAQELTAQIRAMSKIKAANRGQQMEKEQLEALVAARTRELARELAERKRVEEKLRESLGFNEALLQTIPFGMSIVNEEGRLLFVHGPLARAGSEPAVGQQCWEVYRDDRQQCADCPLKQPIEVGQTKSIESGGVLGGRTFEISHTGMVFQGRKALLEIFLDITERKQAETKVNEQLAELRRWYDVTLGREGRVMALKREINQLLGEVGRPVRYASVADGSAENPPPAPTTPPFPPEGSRG